MLLFIAEEYDDYDREFDKMREATLKTRGVQAREELASAKQNVDECRKNLEYAREQVSLLNIPPNAEKSRSLFSHVKKFPDMIFSAFCVHKIFRKNYF